jgi:hypothetical protein
MFSHSKNDEMVSLKKQLQEKDELILKYKSALQTLKVKYDELLKYSSLNEPILLSDKELKSEFRKLKNSSLPKQQKDILRKILLVVEAEQDKYFYEYFLSKI